MQHYRKSSRAWESQPSKPASPQFSPSSSFSMALLLAVFLSQPSVVFFAFAHLHQKGISKAVLRPRPAASLPHLGSHLTLSWVSVSFLFSLNSGHAFVYVWVCSFPMHRFTCSGIRNKPLGEQGRKSSTMGSRESPLISSSMEFTGSVSAMFLPQRTSPFPVLPVPAW